MPESDHLQGTTNLIEVVVVNFVGQFFYKNRLVSDDELKAELTKAVRDPRHPPTLLVKADRAVAGEVYGRLGDLAHQAGLREMLLASQPHGARPATEDRPKR